MNISHILLACCTVACAFSTSCLENQTSVLTQITSEVMTSRNKLEGTWDYMVKDVPPEYSKGVLRIIRNQKVFGVEVDLSDGSNLKASEVMVRRKNISFYLMINGQRVDVALHVEGDTISGESTSPDGVFKLEGTRRQE